MGLANTSYVLKKIRKNDIDCVCDHFVSNNFQRILVLFTNEKMLFLITRTANPTRDFNFPLYFFSLVIKLSSGQSWFLPKPFWNVFISLDCTLKDINQLYNKNSVTSKSRSEIRTSYCTKLCSAGRNKNSSWNVFFSGIRRYETEHIQE